METVTADVDQLTGERISPAMPDGPYRLIERAYRQQHCEERGNLNR